MNQVSLLKTRDEDIVFREGVKTTSMIVAEHFERDHFNILQSIDSLIVDLKEIDALRSQGVEVDASTSGCVDFNRNFIETKYLDEKGETRRSFDLTRDGFMLLVMGFKGKKALQFKLDFIEQFNAMENHMIDYVEFRKMHLKLKAEQNSNAAKKLDQAQQRIDLRKVEAQNKANDVGPRTRAANEKALTQAYKEVIHEALRSGRGLEYANVKFFGLDPEDDLSKTKH